jgi:hypothetical protein
MAIWSWCLSDKPSLQDLLEVQKHFGLPSPGAPGGRGQTPDYRDSGLQMLSVVMTPQQPYNSCRDPGIGDRVFLSVARLAGGRLPPAFHQSPERREWIDYEGFEHFQEAKGAGLDLPDDLQFLAQRIVFNGGEADEVLRLIRDLGATHAAAHIGDDVAPLADYGELPLFGDRAQGFH